MAPGASDGSGGPDRIGPRLRSLHDHLAATAALPVDRDASRWLGEAEAVAADVADGEAPTAAVETRVAQVRELLSHVEGTGHEGADAHVEAAREDADAILASLGVED